MAGQRSSPTRSCPRLLRLACVLCAIAAWSSSASAQAVDPPLDPRPTAETAPSAPETGESREKRPYLAIAEVIGVNILYAGVNQALPWEDEDDHFRISPRSWSKNLKSRFTFDNDPFIINQFGHPYQGGNYFNAGRSLGLTYWESMPMATLGSVTWEWFGETEVPAWNDVINTTLGGALFGEVLHRLGWLVRGEPRPGAGSRWRALAATALDPVTGLNRLLVSGTSSSASVPRGAFPSRVSGEVLFGVVAGHAGGSLRGAEGIPFGTFALDYGRMEDGLAAAPFDAFTMVMSVGGGETISDLAVRGRLAGRALGSGSGDHALVLAQGYDYLSTPSIHFGSQTFLGGRIDRFGQREGWSVTTSLLAGVAVLGALELPDRGEARELDYGPGILASGSAVIARRGHPVGRLSCQSTYLRTLTQSPADHVVTVLRAEARLPLWRGFALGIAGEHVIRDSHGERFDKGTGRYTRARAYTAWEFAK